MNILRYMVFFVLGMLLGSRLRTNLASKCAPVGTICDSETAKLF